MMEWQAEGDLIILFTDLNEDIRDRKTKQMLSTVGLVDIAMALHPQQPPATHNRGSALIDRIFVPVTLTKYCQAGYLAFGDTVPSDHHAMWLDIPAQLVCPHIAEPIEQPLACRLQCKDPRVVTKYNQILWELLHTSGMATRAQALAQAAKTRLTKCNKKSTIDKAAMEY